VEAELAAMAPRTLQLSIFHWNAWLARYAKTGQYEKIRQLFQQMQQEGIPPDSLTFVQVLNAHANLQAHEEGRQVHKQVTPSGWESNVCVGSSLVDIYAKCGSMDEAWRVFHKMPTCNVVSWNVIILGYVKCGQGHKALDLF
jgi:pentatricopeptide repeat protein